MSNILATIQSVDSIAEIPGADHVVCARIIAWDCMVKRNQFKPGDLGVLFEYDSIVDKTNPMLSFMEQRSYRVKAQIFLKGTFKSMALFLPLDVLGHYGKLARNDENKIVGLRMIGDDHEEEHTIMFYEGLDVTELSKTEKYSFESYQAGHIGGKTKLGNMDARGTYPQFLRKTDEINIQKFRWNSLKELLSGVPLYASEKADGSSMTVWYDHNDPDESGAFHVMSRNYDLKRPPEDLTKKKTVLQEDGTLKEIEWKIEENLFWKVARKYDLENVMKRYPGKAIQMELVGENCQSNRLGLLGNEIRVFNLWDIEKQKYLPVGELEVFCRENGLPMVKIVHDNFLIDDIPDVVDMLKLAEGFYDNGTHREGLVWRPVNEMESQMFSENGFRVSFKTINSEFESKVLQKKQK